MARRDGDFERVVLPHARSLLRFALRLADDSFLAEDLVQETLLRAWRGFGRFEPGTNAHAWLFQILMNVFRQQKRKAHSRFVPEALADSVQATQPSTEESVEVMQAFERLGGEQRTVLLLAAVEGFTCREIAEILAVPIGTVMSRLSRGREAMREMLSEVAP
ncbi:MAG: sigma-70 family RNA polymerase sigma factor [Bryobacteraceae bacterium]|jgi:RNA polymerase sigma-70 factor, ECF subfamily